MKNNQIFLIMLLSFIEITSAKSKSSMTLKTKTKQDPASWLLEQLTDHLISVGLEIAWNKAGDVVVDGFGVDPEKGWLNYFGWGNPNKKTLERLDNINENLDKISSELEDLSENIDNLSYDIYDGERKQLINEISEGADMATKKLSNIAKQYKTNEVMSEDNKKKSIKILEKWAKEHLADPYILMEFLQKPFMIGKRFVDHYDDTAKANLRIVKNGLKFRNSLRTEDALTLLKTAMLSFTYYKIKDYHKSFDKLQKAMNDFRIFMKKTEECNNDDLLGWKIFDDKKFYFNKETGDMLTGAHKVEGDWYEFDRTNGLAEGWVEYKSGVTNYYRKYDPKTKKAYTGWQNFNGKKYYFDEKEAKLIPGIRTVDWNGGKSIFYFTKEGLLFGWQNFEGNKYYLSSPDGIALTGKHYIDGKLYYFDVNEGYLLTGLQVLDYGDTYSLFYIDEDGNKKSGWIDIKGRPNCHFDTNDGHFIKEN